MYQLKALENDVLIELKSNIKSLDLAFQLAEYYLRGNPQIEAIIINRVSVSGIDTVAIKAIPDKKSMVIVTGILI